MQLRNYQSNFKNDIYTSWQHVQNVLAVLATGGGKTPVIANIITEHHGISKAIAHRRELISQISTKLALCGLRHNIMAPTNIIKWIIQLHVEETGRSYYDANALCTVASVDTIKSRKDKLKNILYNTTLWVTDECHHILKKNKWGAAIELLPNARGLGMTATPCRADGYGLGRHADGVFDIIVEGPDTRKLITAGYLCDYKIFAPPSDLIMNGAPVGAKGDWSPKQLKQSAQKSCIVGDVIKHYLRIAPGKLGLTFATDLDTAANIVSKFKQAGVPAEMVCGTTPDKIRVELVRRLKRREILQLVNVNLYGEGVDIPEIEVVSMGRPTASFALYRQQFGRLTRKSQGKEYGILIDHVYNVKRHGLPDAKTIWTLNRRERRPSKKPDGRIPTHTCLKCTAVYEALYTQCPECGFEYVPAERSKPEYVDGDLIELDTTVLAKMQKEIDRIDAPDDILRTKMLHAGANGAAVIGATKNHRLRQDAQSLLRISIAWWAGHHHDKGRTKSQCYKLFYWTFGIDVMTAQTLGRTKAHELSVLINKNIDEMRSIV
jgi:DNA repair protein RadD